MVNHQPAAFHVKDFHAGAGPVDKNEHIPILDIPPHLVGHNTAEGVKTAAHVCRIRIQVVSHRRGKAEHPTLVLKPTGILPSPDPQGRLPLP